MISLHLCVAIFKKASKTKTMLHYQKFTQSNIKKFIKIKGIEKTLQTLLKIFKIC